MRHLLFIFVLAACGKNISVGSSSSTIDEDAATDAETSVLDAGCVSCETVPSDESTVAVGRYFSCALKSSDVYCWGINTDNQLGGGTAEAHSTSPVLVPLDEAAIQLSAGPYHVCAVTEENRVYCWGNTDGLYLRGEPPSRPAEISVDEPVTQVSAGVAHTCVRTSNGRAYCWGTSGLLGVDPDTLSAYVIYSPNLIPTLSEVVQVAAGDSSSCAVVESGKVYCWGDNTLGQLGDGEDQKRVDTPREVINLDDAIQVAVGYGYACALRAEGSIVCWGSNTHGQLGTGGDSTDKPADVSGLHSATMVTASWDQQPTTCAVLESGEARCWGFGSNGRVGNGNTTSSLDRYLYVTVPETVLIDGAVQSISTGQHGCASVGEEVYCWGTNVCGELGIEETGDCDGYGAGHFQGTPVRVSF